MLYQIGNNQFLVIKKTWPGMFILGIGALFNVLMNWVLIPVMGIEGAAIATLIEYAVTDIVDIVVLVKCNLMTVGGRFFLVSFLTMSFMITWRLLFSSNICVGVVLWLLYVAFFWLLYKDDIRRIKKELLYKKGE